MKLLYLCCDAGLRDAGKAGNLITPGVSPHPLPLIRGTRPCCRKTYTLVVGAGKEGGSSVVGGARRLWVCLGIALLFAGVVGLIYMYMIPHFAAFYADFSGGQTQLPPFTRSMIRLSDFITGNWVILLLLILGSAVFIALRTRVPTWLVGTCVGVALLLGLSLAVVSIYLPASTLTSLIK
jgi:hypothetical protein